MTRQSSAPMPQPRVFISYCHQDQQFLRSLLPFLKSLETEGVAGIWIDTNLRGGDRWCGEIDAALDAASIAILMVSQSFLVSRFILEHELPRILCRQLSGALKVTPVFIGPSTVTSTSIPYTDCDGRQRHATLSDFQGFGTPAKTMRELRPVERDRSFLALHEYIRSIVAADADLDTHGRTGAAASATTDEAHGAVSHAAPGVGAPQTAQTNVREPTSGRPDMLPKAIILDRHYAYTLTNYATDPIQHSSQQLLDKYRELFDVISCSVLLFDEIFLEQHHVSSIEPVLDHNETAAFSDLFTPFSLMQSVGSAADNATVDEMIRDDCRDSAFDPLIAAFCAPKSIPPGYSKEVLTYLNKIMQHADALDAGIFVKRSRMPLFGHKLAWKASAARYEPCKMPHVVSVSLRLPGRKLRTLDELVALRDDSCIKDGRARLHAQINERADRSSQGTDRVLADIDARDLLRSADFSRTLELTVWHPPLAPFARDSHFIILDA